MVIFYHNEASELIEKGEYEERRILKARYPRS